MGQPAPTQEVETVEIISQESYSWLLRLTEFFQGDEEDLQNFLERENVELESSNEESEG